MTPVDQTIVHQGDGDCTRAVVASLLDLTIEQVPHFNRFGDRWHDVLDGFLELMGVECEGVCSVKCGERPAQSHVAEYQLDGYLYGSVNSRTFKGGGHAVVIDMQGIVIHDPNPNKSFQGVDVIASGELEYWYLLRRRPADGDGA